MIANGIFAEHLELCSSVNCQCVNVAQDIDLLAKYKKIKMRSDIEVSI